MKNLRHLVVACLCALGLASCATAPSGVVASECFRPSSLRGFEIQAPDEVRVWNGQQSWIIELSGSCPELSRARTLVFTDEMMLRMWPDQPWLHGFGTTAGWPWSGSYINQNSTLMRVCSNRQSWVHAFDGFGEPVGNNFASFGCRVDRVIPVGP